MNRAGPIAAGLCAALCGQAWAGLEVCNNTHELQAIAIGYKGESDWSSEGWWNIKPGDCAVLVSGDLTKRYYYYHAASKGGGFRGQDFMFCTNDDEFSIVGDTGCEKRGHNRTEFREIDTGETATSFTLTLTASQTRAGSGGGAKAPGGGGETGGGVATQTVTEAPETPDVEVHQAALDTGLPPGRSGRPFEKGALFQGCELEDGRAYCSFHADGVKLRAFHKGPTPEELLLALEEMPLNTPVMLTGDMAEERGMLASVVLRRVLPRNGADRQADLRRTVQGDWVSVSDRRSEITIRGSEIYVRYNGDFRVTRFMTLATRCEGLRGDGPVLIQTSMRDRRPTCYRVARADARSLELEAVNGGKVLRFRRPE